MYKKTITYKDFNGEDRKEDFYFHLSLPEVTRIEAETGDELEKHLDDLIKNKDIKELLNFMERVMLDSYGIKSSDGRTFKKSKEIRESFEYSNAYAEFFEELVTNPEMAKKFGENVADNGKPRKNSISPDTISEE